MRAALLQAEANKEAGLGGDEAEIADPIPAEAQAQFTSAGINKGGAVVHAPGRMLPVREADVSAEERERRRKGKGIMVDAGQGAIKAGRALRISEYNSGSDSWDLMNAGAHIANDDSSFSSKDADSRALLAGGPIQQQTNDEDMDLGGNGGGDEKGGTHGEKDMRKEEGGSGEAVIKKEEEMMKVTKETESKEPEGEKMAVKAQEVEKTVIVISDDSKEGGSKGKVAAAAGRRGTSVSVPPGFQRIHGARLLSKGGSSLPFRKLQKGGFRFLKRSSSSATSGARMGAAATGKKSKPISSLPNQAIEEVAKNVGIA